MRILSLIQVDKQVSDHGPPQANATFLSVIIRVSTLCAAKAHYQAQTGKSIKVGVPKHPQTTY